MNIKASKWKFNLIMILCLISILLFLKFYLENEWNRMRIDAANKTGKTIVCKTAFDIMANNTYMIISKSGKVVVMDPYDMIPGPKPDLITVSHLHGDHYDEEYVNNMNCKKSISKIESSELEDIKMISLASSHDTSPINISNPTNVIYYLEIDSLKIAHLGDFGQSELTDEQKEVLQGIDILIMPCQYHPVTEKSLNNILDELHPPIIFLTHTDKERMDVLKNKISGKIVLKEKYIISKAEIDNNFIKLIVLERNDHNLLFARYIVYKFTGSPLFKYMIVLIIIVVSVLSYIKYKRKKSLDINLNKEL